MTLKTTNNLNKKQFFILRKGKNLSSKTSQDKLKTLNSTITNDNSFLKNFDVFFNFSFDKGRLKSFVVWFLKTYGESKTIVLLEKLKEIGFGYATKAGISLGIDDLMIPPQKTELLVKADKKTNKGDLRYTKAAITAVERLQNFMTVWHETSENLKKEVVNHFEATDILNPVYMMAFSGARGNLSQVRQLVGMRGLMSDPQGQIIDFPIRSNFREGLTLTEYVISTYGARKGIVDTALRTANAGYLTRRLVDVAQHVIVSEFDCRTHRGIFIFDMKEGTKTIYPLQQRLIGRVLAEDIYSGDTKIAYRNQEISKQSAEMLTKLYKKFLIRSPLTCATKTFVCQLCYGWSLATNRLVPIGEAVGVIAGQSIGEPGTQLTMRTFHTGGVFSGGISDQITANYDCIVEYPTAIVGNCIRTPQGEIAFLTKTNGYMILKPANVKKKQESPTFSSTKENTNVFTAVAKVLKVPPYSLLFARNGQRILKEELIALFSSVGLQERQTMYSEQILYSDREGEVYTSNMEMLELTINQTIRMKPGSENVPKQIQFVTKDWSELLILAGKNYQMPVDSTLFPYSGDFISSNSILSKIAWITSENCILLKQKQIGDKSFVSKTKDVGPGIQFFSHDSVQQKIMQKNQNDIKPESFSKLKEEKCYLNKKTNFFKNNMQQRFYNFKSSNSVPFVPKTLLFNRHFQFPLYFTPSPKFTKAILASSSLQEKKLQTKKNSEVYKKPEISGNKKRIFFIIKGNYNVPSLFYTYEKTTENKLKLRRNSIAEISKINFKLFLQNQKDLLKQNQTNKKEILPTMYSNNFIRQGFLNLPKVSFYKTTEKKFPTFNLLTNTKKQVLGHTKKATHSNVKQRFKNDYPFHTSYYGTISTNNMKKNFPNNVKILKFRKFKIRKMRYNYNVHDFIFLNKQIKRFWWKKTIKAHLIKSFIPISTNKFQHFVGSKQFLKHKFFLNNLKKHEKETKNKKLKYPLLPFAWSGHTSVNSVCNVVTDQKQSEKAKAQFKSRDFPHVNKRKIPLFFATKKFNSFVFNNSEFSKYIENNLFLTDKKDLSKRQFFVKKFHSLSLIKPILSFSLANVCFQKHGYNFSLNLRPFYTKNGHSSLREAMISFSGLKEYNLNSNESLEPLTIQKQEKRNALNTYNWKPSTEILLQWIPNTSISCPSGLFLTSSSLLNTYKALTYLTVAKNNSLTYYQILEKNEILKNSKSSISIPNLTKDNSSSSTSNILCEVNLFSDLIFLLKKQVLIYNSSSVNQNEVLQKNKNFPDFSFFMPYSIPKQTENYLAFMNISPFNKKLYNLKINEQSFSLNNEKLKTPNTVLIKKKTSNRTYYKIQNNLQNYYPSVKILSFSYLKKKNQVYNLLFLNFNPNFQNKEFLEKVKNQTFTELMEQVCVNFLAKTSLGNYTTQTKVFSNFYYVIDKFSLNDNTYKKELQIKNLSFQKKVTKSFKHCFLFIRRIQSYFSMPCSCQPKSYVCSTCIDEIKVFLLQKEKEIFKKRLFFHKKLSLNKFFQKETLTIKDILPFPYVNYGTKKCYFFNKPRKNFNEKFVFSNKPSHQTTFTKGGILEYIKRYTVSVFGRSDSKKARKGIYRLLFRKLNQEKNNKSFAITSTKNLLNLEKHIVKKKENDLVFTKPLYTDQRRFAKMTLTSFHPSKTKLNSKLSVYDHEVLWLPQERYKLFSFDKSVFSFIEQKENKLNFSLNQKSCYFSVKKDNSIFQLVNRQGKKQSHILNCNGILKLSLHSESRSQTSYLASLNLPNRYIFNSPFGVPGLQTFSLKTTNLHSTDKLLSSFKNPFLKYSSLSILLVEQNRIKSKGKEKTVKKVFTNYKYKKLQRSLKSKLNVYIFNAVVSKFYNLNSILKKKEKVKNLNFYSLQKSFFNQSEFLGHFLFKKKPNHNYFNVKFDQNKTSLIPQLVNFETQNKFINIEIQKGWIYFCCLDSPTSYSQNKLLDNQNKRIKAQSLTTKHECIFNPGKSIFDDISFDKTYVYTKCISLNKVNFKLMTKEDFIQLQKYKHCTVPFTKIDKILQNKKCRFKPPIFTPLKLPYSEVEKGQSTIESNLNERFANFKSFDNAKVLEEPQNQIALVILPLQHKIVPNVYYYKRHLYRGQKNTRKVSSLLMRKNYYLNHFNKQYCDQKLVSCYPGVDIQLRSNFKVLKLNKKNNINFMTSSTLRNKRNQRGFFSKNRNRTNWNFKKSKKMKSFKKDQSHNTLNNKSTRSLKNFYKKKLFYVSKNIFSKVKKNGSQFGSEMYYSSYPVYFSNFLLTANFSKDFYYQFNKVEIDINSIYKTTEINLLTSFMSNYNSKNKWDSKKIFLNELHNDNWNKTLTVSLAGNFAFFANQRLAANFWTNQSLKNLMKPTSLSMSQTFLNFPVFRNTILSNSFNYFFKNQILGFTSFFSPLIGEVIPASSAFSFLKKNQEQQTNMWLKNMATQVLVLSSPNLFSVRLEFDQSHEHNFSLSSSSLSEAARKEAALSKETNLKQVLFNHHQHFLKSEKISKIMHETPIFNQNENVFVHNNKLYKVKNIPVGYARIFKPLRLGSILKYGTPITHDSSMCKAGQIIHMSSQKITLRHAQIFLASSRSILHVKPGEFIYPNVAVLTLPFQTLKTGDIVQGIPKVEQYFEARETKAGRLFSGSLPNLLHSLFKRYCSFLARDLAVRKSILKIQQILVDGVQRVYRSQGVDIIDKHLEVIVRQITSRVQIVHPGETAFFPGELIDLTFMELINPYLLKPIKYVPIILGITRASLEVDSFLSAASFQHTVKILSKAALYRKKDFLKGLKENLITANLIRAGTGYFLYNKKL